MKRLAVIVFAVAIAVLAAGILPHAAMAYPSPSGHAAEHCMDGHCPVPADPSPADCADRCLAAGTVGTVTEVTLTFVTAFGILALVASIGPSRRNGPTASRPFAESIGKMLALERLATDVLRN